MDTRNCDGMITERKLNDDREVVTTALLEVENLTVTAIGDDSFTVSWKRPLGSFDNYVVDVVLENIAEVKNTDSKVQSIGSCLPRTLMNEGQTSITCNNVPACSNVTVTVHTQDNEAHQRESQGISVPVFIHGGAPEEFSVYRAYYDFTSVGLFIDVSNVSSCQVGACYVQLDDGASSGEKLQCHLVSETQRGVYLRGLETGKPYKYRVSLQNPYNFKEAVRVITVIAQSLPEVKGLSVSAISDDSFTVSWERPHGTFDKYIVEVTNNLEDHEDDNSTDSEEQGVGSCLTRTLMNPNETSITCDNVPACSNVTVTVLTQSNKTRPRTSQGVSLPIFIHGGGIS
ncbi:hypothetical protein MTO96_007677 [Rhipicephalus appendiculatus]